MENLTTLIKEAREKDWREENSNALRVGIASFRSVDACSCAWRLRKVFWVSLRLATALIRDEGLETNVGEATKAT